MNKNINRSNSRNMLNTTNGFLGSNAAIINTMPGLQSSCTGFSGIIDSINEKMIIVDTGTTGITQDKHAQRIIMEANATMIAERTMGYAASVNKNALYQTMFQCSNSINKASESSVVDRCNTIKKAAVDNLANLEAWNVTDTEIEIFTEAILNYTVLCNKQSGLIKTIAVARKEADALIKKAKNLLTKTIDKGVKSFIGTQPTFVAEYKLARRIINLGHRHTQFKGVTISKETQQHLANVQIEFRNQSGSFKVTSDYTGKYREQLTPDVYDMIATHPNFEPFVIEGIKILPGEIKVENIEMIPVNNINN